MEVSVAQGAEVECVGGHLWLTVMPSGRNFFVDDKFLVPGQRFLAMQDFKVWISSFRGEPAAFRIRPGLKTGHR
jgi:hypothetical protein